MDYDTDKIDEYVLVVLYLTLHDNYHAWKNISWDAMNRLHEKGFIDNPINKRKSVAFTEKGLAEAERLFDKHFLKKT